MSAAPPLPSTRPRSAGFTLIELLVVIAIIAILMAIIFPVFATLRENARQKTAMANLHQIEVGLAQFKLDNGRYPDVLFGYAVPNARMDNALQIAEQYDAANAGSNITAQYFPGLYPEYIKDPATFEDPNNAIRDLSKTTANANGPLQVNYLTETDATDYTLAQTTQIPATPPAGVTPITTNFYLADAYDISPEIAGANQLVGGNGSPSTYVVRYQPNWTPISPTDQTTNYPLNYSRQLRWSNPPASTYVTCTTHHVPNSNKVIVLFEEGDAVVMDSARFLGGAAGSPANSNADSASVATANFWQVSPTANGNPGP